MTRSTLAIIAGLALAPLSASAQLGNANAVLRGKILALQASGFSGIEKISVPQAPADAQAVANSVEVDETTEALAALSRESKTDSGLGGLTARALGFNFDGDLIPIKNIITPKIQDVIRFFYVTTFRGTPDIIIQEIRRVNGRKELRSYLVSPNGVLEAAAVTTKVNGKLQAEPISVLEAQAGCQELLEFWIQYYRDNLKPH